VITEARDELHDKIAVQLSQKPYGGTFTEYNPKVIQFGFIAMFSSTFPLSAICAAVSNFIELRIDSFKLVSLARRPRYAGAEDIGSWATVIATISWIALPVNVALLAFTSWSFRDRFIVPFVVRGLATETPSCYDTQFDIRDEVTDSFTIPAESTLSLHAWADGRNTSYTAVCEENVLDCFATIGGAYWLPASIYLVNGSTATVSYMDGGLCNPNHVLLYDPRHCEVCRAWSSSVVRLSLWVFLLVEHFLMLIKLCLGNAISDVPRWVTQEVSRKSFEVKLKKDRAEAKAREIRERVAGAKAVNPKDRQKRVAKLVKTINDQDPLV